MRQQSKEALEKNTSSTAEISSQVMVRPVINSLNWFGSKESIGMFTGRIRSGLRDTPRASHGLETRPLRQIIDEKEASEKNANKIVKLPDHLKRKELISA